MKNITLCPLLLACIVTLFSCKDGNINNNDNGSTDLYFPVEKLVQAQADSLKKTGDVWVKTVNNDDEYETKKLVAKDVDWKIELALFFDLTPNKKAYAGKFNIDTAVKENEKIITYHAADLKLSMLTVVQNNDGSVRAIYGDLSSTNLFYHSDYELSLVPYKAFAISGKQTLAFFNSEKNFSIQWIKEMPDSTTLFQ